MPGARWTTPDQLDFLMARRTEFLEANVKNTKRDFYLEVFTDWFQRWPLLSSMFPGKIETELDSSELEKYQKALSDKKSQISSWFRRLLRDGAPKSAKVDKVTQEILELLKAEIDLQKVSRKMQRLEIYQVLYNEKINPAVKDECIAAGAMTQSQRMSIRRRFVQEMFDNEVPSVRQSVEEQYLAQEDGVDIRPSLKNLDGSSEEDLAVSEVNDGENSPEAYQAALDASTSLLLKMMTICSQKNKWTYHCMMGGAVPQKNGRTCMEHYTIGGPTTSAGLTFPQAYKNYNAGILGPFSDYLYEVYTPEIRASMSLNLPETQYDVRDFIGQVIDITKTVGSDGLIRFDDSESANGTNANGKHVNATDEPQIMASSEKSANGAFQTMADLPPVLSYDYTPSVPPPSSPVVSESLPSLHHPSPASSPPPDLRLTNSPARHPEVTFSQQMGGPTEPIRDAISRMNAETDLRQEMERTQHFDINVIDPQLRGDGPGNGTDSNYQLSMGDIPTLEGNNASDTGTIEEVNAKRTSRNAKTVNRPGTEHQTQEERRTSSRARKPAPLRPTLVSDPSKTPNRRVKPSWYYEDVAE